jgi:hypothetical protein
MAFIVTLREKWCEAMHIAALCWVASTSIGQFTNPPHTVSYPSNAFSCAWDQPALTTDHLTVIHHHLLTGFCSLSPQLLTLETEWSHNYHPEIQLWILSQDKKVHVYLFKSQDGKELAELGDGLHNNTLEPGWCLLSVPQLCKSFLSLFSFFRSFWHCSSSLRNETLNWGCEVGQRLVQIKIVK